MIKAKYDFSEIANLLGATNVYTKNFPEQLLKAALLDSNLPEKIEVLYLWKKNNSNQALIITPDILLYINENKTVGIFDINKISHVRFHLEGTSFYIFSQEKGLSGKIPVHFFGLQTKNANTNTNRDIITDFFNNRIKKGKFKYNIDDFFEFTIKEIEELGNIDDIVKLDNFQKEEYANKVISIYEDFINKHGKDEIFFGLEYYLAIALALKNENYDAIEIIDTIIDNHGQIPNLDAWYTLKANLLEDMNEKYDAILCYKEIYSLSNDIQNKLEYQKLIDELSKTFIDNFAELPYQKRKFILIDNDFKSTAEDTFMVLPVYNLPQNIKFSNNYPRKDELYILHPNLKDVYILFSEYEEIIFKDRFEEFSYFIQCLGAKSMTITVVKGNLDFQSELINSASNKNNQQIIDGSVGIKGFGVNGINKDIKNLDSNKITNQEVKMENKTSFSRTQNFKPTKKPYLPSGMIWFENESSWQRLYKQRTTGNLISHHDILSSKTNYSISDNEKSALKEEFVNHIGGGINFPMADGKINLNTEKKEKITELVESTFIQNETIQWEIEIDFELIDNLTDESENNDLTNNYQVNNLDFENEYIDEIKFMLEDDGVIDDKERRVLERFREKKNVSKQRAEMLEKNIFSIRSLKDNEKEYLFEYQELLKDGEITEKERRILNRFATRLDLTEERILQLENSVL